MARIVRAQGKCDNCGESFDMEANITGFEDEYIDSFIVRRAAKTLTDWLLRRRRERARVRCHCGNIFEVSISFSEGRSATLGQLTYSSKGEEKTWLMERR